MIARRAAVGAALWIGLAAIGGEVWLGPVGVAHAVVRASVDAGAEWQGDSMISWAEVDVAATPDQAFAVLTDYDRMREFLPGVLYSRVVSRDGATVIVEQQSEESALFFSQRIEARLAIIETPPRNLTLRAITGSFRSFEGSYHLVSVPAPASGPSAGGLVPAARAAEPWTRIVYRGRFVPDFDLPRMVGPYVVKRSLERHLTALKKEIDRRVVASRPFGSNP